MEKTCTGCVVSAGTHKPAEAVHQIDEPQAEALRLADALDDDETYVSLAMMRQAAAELRAQHASIAEMEAQLEAIGAGGVEPLRKPAAPQAVQAAVPLFWVRLLRDGLYEGPVHNNSVGGKMLRDEKPGEWHPLYLHTAPAHPAEVVPEQSFKTKVYQALSIGSACDEHVVFVNIENLIRRADCLSAIERELFMVETPPDESEGDTEPGEECLLNWGHDPEEYVKQFAEALAATQPAAQGMELANCKGGKWLTVVYRDIQPGDEARTIGEHPKVSALSWSHALNDRDAALAAQAKQGGA